MRPRSPRAAPCRPCRLFRRRRAQRRPYPPELNYPLHEERWTDDWFSLNFVGRANANSWGLYDMHGNAAEWTATTVDGRAIVRGGSFASRPKDATSSFRQRYLPWQKVFDVGFRVVIEDWSCEK